jgi:hypothetical protein
MWGRARARWLPVVIALVVALATSESDAAPTSSRGNNEAIACLALDIYFEARGEPTIGQLAVAHVVMNRVFDPRFPHDVCDVVYQRDPAFPTLCQFSWTCDGLGDTPTDPAAWRLAQALANRAYFGLSHDPTEGALWYHADYVDPDWTPWLGTGTPIGRHVFYRLPAGLGNLPVALGGQRPATRGEAMVEHGPVVSSIPPATRAFLRGMAVTMLVYAEQATSRVVRINRSLYHEGDALPQGLRLVSITPTGIVMRRDDRWFRITF